MLQVAVVHNIPTPYRNHLFMLLSDELARRGADFTVHFMATQLTTRPGNWLQDEPPLPFRHLFWRDCGLDCGGERLHFNPGLIKFLLARPPDVLVIGGPWASITGLVGTLLAPSVRTFAWLEGNPKCPGRSGAVATAIKRFLLKRCVGCIVPGAEGRRYIEKNVGISLDSRSCVILPNIVDEERFRPAFETTELERAVAKSELGVGAEKKMAIWPARLMPQKGVCEFLRRLDRRALDGWHILLLGEGPLRKAVTDTIEACGLFGHVTVVGALPYGMMMRLYCAADLFLLPSLQDPNPLSVVEALHSGLPLLVSNRIGNLPEALLEGWNGWSVDPIDQTSVDRAITEAFGSSVSKLQEMGKRSRELAVRHFNSMRVVRLFVDSILG